MVARESKMKFWKLDRMENVHWDPPRLLFTIERHGATVNAKSKS